MKTLLILPTIISFVAAFIFSVIGDYGLCVFVAMISVFCYYVATKKENTDELE